MQDTDTYFMNSESDAETKSQYKKYASQRSCPVNSSILSAASAGLVNKSNIGSPSSANSNIVHFEYEEKDQSTDSEHSYSRANSLPGSLQFCVGSLMDSSANNTVQSPSLAQSIVNKNLGGLCGSPKSSTSSQPNSPNLTIRQNQSHKIDNEISQAPKLYFYVNNKNFDATKNQAQPRKISFQVGAKSITVKQPQQQQQFLITSMTKPTQNVNIRKQAPVSPIIQPTSNSNSNSVLYRTEITILPSSNGVQNKQQSVQKSTAPSASVTSSSSNKIIRF